MSRRLREGSSRAGPATRVVPPREPAARPVGVAPASALRRATAALRPAAEVDREWSDQDIAEVAAAVAEHLLAVAAVLPSDVPGWLIDWHRLARRHGLLVTSVVDDPANGVDALVDLKVRLDQLADRAEECAGRHEPLG